MQPGAMGGDEVKLSFMCESNMDVEDQLGWYSADNGAIGMMFPFYIGTLIVLQHADMHAMESKNEQKVGIIGLVFFF